MINLRNILKSFSKPNNKSHVGEDLDQIKTLFTNIERDTQWNLKGKMLFGYFFFSYQIDQLENLVKDLNLQEKFFRKVSLEKVDSNNSFRLHVEETNIHTPESLVERNKAFNELANKFSSVIYDGFDIGPIK